MIRCVAPQAARDREYPRKVSDEPAVDESDPRMQPVSCRATSSDSLTSPATDSPAVTNGTLHGSPVHDDPRLTKVKLIIVAATGGIGRQLLEQAAEAGHNVTAIVRNPGAIPRTTRTFVTDLANADSSTLQSAIESADAVLSGLGARSSADDGVAARGTRAIVQAMRAVGVKRIVVVSAAPLGTVPSPGHPNPPRHDPGDGFFMRHLLAPLTKAALRHHYADLARMEDVLRDSSAEWTIVRPPRLTNGPKNRRYRIAFGQNLRRGLSISRADVADFMLRAVEDPKTIRQVIGIAD
jgi:putative NADH-flavin reductase